VSPLGQVGLLGKGPPPRAGLHPAETPPAAGGCTTSTGGWEDGCSGRCRGPLPRVSPPEPLRFFCFTRGGGEAPALAGVGDRLHGPGGPASSPLAVFVQPRRGAGGPPGPHRVPGAAPGDEGLLRGGRLGAAGGGGDGWRPRRSRRSWRRCRRPRGEQLSRRAQAQVAAVRLFGADGGRGATKAVGGRTRAGGTLHHALRTFVLRVRRGRRKGGSRPRRTRVLDCQGVRRDPRSRRGWSCRGGRLAVERGPALDLHPGEPACCSPWARRPPSVGGVPGQPRRHRHQALAPEGPPTPRAHRPPPSRRLSAAQKTRAWTRPRRRWRRCFQILAT